MRNPAGERNMDRNGKIAEYENHLREAERAIELALQSICSLTGEDVNSARYNLQYKALEEVQNAIRGTYKLYV